MSTNSAQLLRSAVCRLLLSDTFMDHFAVKFRTPGCPSESKCKSPGRFWSLELLERFHLNQTGLDLKYNEKYVRKFRSLAKDPETVLENLEGFLLTNGWDV